MSLKPERVDFVTMWADLKYFVSYRFSDVYSLCVAYSEPVAEKLYQETKKFLEEHVKSLWVQVNGISSEGKLLINNGLLAQTVLVSRKSTSV